jgi:tungstate transport system substrate-binding protein
VTHPHNLLATICIALSILVNPSFAQSNALNQSKELRMATTTSTYDSGLLQHLKPLFEKHSGLTWQVISGGTGKAIQLGQRGDVDVLLVHSRPDEDKYISEGHGTVRRDVMLNDFVIVGPENDPAKIAETKTAADALIKIANAKATFVSRGDDSGTHKMEMRTWATTTTKPNGDWYLSVGNGMAETLRIADQKNGYTLTDRSTFLSQRKKLKLKIVMQGDPAILNPYGVMDVNPKKNDKINHIAAQKFIAWITSDDGQTAIRNFKVDGETIFFPNANADANAHTSIPAPAQQK